LRPARRGLRIVGSALPPRTGIAAGACFFAAVIKARSLSSNRKGGKSISRRNGRRAPTISREAIIRRQIAREMTRPPVSCDSTYPPPPCLCALADRPPLGTQCRARRTSFHASRLDSCELDWSLHVFIVKGPRALLRPPKIGPFRASGVVFEYSIWGFCSRRRMLI